MQVGVPKEIKVHESRVAITPLNISEEKYSYQALAQGNSYEFSPIG